MMSKIYITGASGFVGTNLVSYLLSGGYNVVKYERGQEDNQEKMLESMNDAEVIVHLAGLAHDLKKTSSIEEYYQINTELTKKIFDIFLKSGAKKFIFISSTKAYADKVVGFLSETDVPKPQTHYGKSKLLAEQYLSDSERNKGKKVYILRPAMIHGPGNKGNLNLLYKFVQKNIGWPLGCFQNQRSFLSVDNLCFIIGEIVERHDIPVGEYFVADEPTLSTNDLVSIIAEETHKKMKIYRVNKLFIQFLARIGDITGIFLTTERLEKLTENYVVSSSKIRKAIAKSLPFDSREGIRRTIRSFEIHNTASDEQ